MEMPICGQLPSLKMPMRVLGFDVDLILVVCTVSVTRN